ncbi:exodeoxyribonuclease V alpha subunit [Candidatus Magnetomoraceae bacterium gMMP-15]
MNLKDTGIFSNLDIHFAKFISRISKPDSTELFMASALVSHWTSKGHICLNLASVAGKSFDQIFKDKNDINYINILREIRCPELSDWLNKLKSTNVVGQPGEVTPMILDNNSRLYLYRYWDYEKKLADNLKERAEDFISDINFTVLQNGLKRLFPGADKPDWQKIAALCAVINRLCIISGGPGTGKTFIVLKIIELLLEQADKKHFHIALAAPTGKAAARLQESLQNAQDNINISNIKDLIPEKASTIHRLLGSIPNSPYFRFNEENQLPVDAVIVDEASMVDLPLMSKLVQAIPQKTRLILLGDKDQLASVEVGAVLGDICSNEINTFSNKFSKIVKQIIGYNINGLCTSKTRSIQDCIILLKKNYRFLEDSGINAVSIAVNQGNANDALSCMKSSEDIKWSDLPDSNNLLNKLMNQVIQNFSHYLKTNNPEEAFEYFNEFRILCAVRKGPYGVKSINRIVEQILKKEGLLNPKSRWYKGQPIMITQNDYHLKLFNGDVGIILPDPDKNNLQAFFLRTDGKVKKFSPGRLPDHETVYAMTVHKSQGSEFNSVLMILPDRRSPVMTRELVYTGVTRAKKNVELWGNKNVFHETVSRCIKRTSGLRDALWRIT